MNKKTLQSMWNLFKQLSSVIIIQWKQPCFFSSNMLERNNSVSTLQHLHVFSDKSRHLEPATMFMNCSQTEGAPFW